VGRIAALLALATLVGVYYGTVGDLPSARLWWEIAWLAFAIIPAVCEVVLRAARAAARDNNSR
jgi:hypothetical protein